MRIFSVFSHQPIGKSESAEFLFCPSCGRERTIEFRTERLYACVFRIPIYPVKQPYESCRCLTCRARFKIPEIRAVQKEADEFSRKQLTMVMAGMIRHFDWESKEHFDSWETISAEKNLPVDFENVAMVLRESPWAADDMILWVSRQSDILDSPTREKLFGALCRYARQVGWKADERLEIFGNAIGLGEEAVASTIREIFS